MPRLRWQQPFGQRGPGGKPLLKCWTSNCEYRAIIDKLGMGHNHTTPRTNGRDGYDEETAKRVQRAKNILSAAREANLSAEDYFIGRGIKVVPDNVYLLPASKAKRLGLIYANYPRVVVPVVNRDGDEVGCHTIVLTRDGTKKLRLKDKRKSVKFSYGVIAGNFIEVGKADPGQPLMIAEGYETTASVAQTTGRPGIATCGAEFLKRVNPPDCSEAIICGDNDANNVGRKAAEALAQRLTIPTRIAIPNGPHGTDWNDLLVSGVKRLKHMILSADIFVRNERPLITRAVADFETRPLEWFWRPFIPLAMATTMFGDGGVGKSTVCIDLISRLTRAKRMPLCQKGAVSGSALILTKEDDVERLVRPRLEAAKAELDRVHMVGYEVPDDPKDFEPIDALDSNIDELERLIVKLGDVRLIVIDPANDFCGKFDPHDDKQVRQFLMPLTRLARRHNLALIIVSHINKSQLQAAHHRGLGSVAWRNVPRSAVLVADDPDVGGRKLMVQTKTNLTEFGRTALGVTMRSVKVGKAGYGAVSWEEDFSDADPEELLAKRKPKTKLERAKDLLQDWLKDGSMLREEIKFMAEGENISWETIKRAKKQLRIRWFKRKGETKYRWKLPQRRT